MLMSWHVYTQLWELRALGGQNVGTAYVMPIGMLPVLVGDRAGE